MEIEGESLQSSCQEALPPAETADDLAARLSGLTHLGVSCQFKEATRELHSATPPTPSPHSGKWGVFCQHQLHSGLSERGGGGSSLGETSPIAWRIWALIPVKNPIT